MTLEEVSSSFKDKWVVARGDTNIVVLAPTAYCHINCVEKFMGRVVFSYTPHHFVFKFPPYFDTLKVEEEIHRIKNEYKIVGVI